MPLSLALLFTALAGFGLVLLVQRIARTWLRYRGTCVVVCPESRERVAVEVDARHAAIAAVRGRDELRLESCTRWPERQGCGEECLAQIQGAPEACRLQQLLGSWYLGKSCALCGRRFERLRFHDHEPGLLAADGAILGWSGFRPEQLIEVLATHAPLCWNCRVAESFRREHPELVTDRPAHMAPPPSMA